MKKRIRKLLIILLAVIFLGSAGYVAYYFINSHIQAKAYAELQHIKEQADTTRPTIGPEGELPTPTPPNYAEVTDPDTGKQQQVLQQFQQLYDQNNDLVGWLEIPGTDINYPVMQTPDRPDYYLTRNFGKKYSAQGCLYARETCDVNTPSDNITIYGHKMRDDTMFGQLERFQNKSFFQKNRYIYFDTLTEIHTYEIVAVFKTTATEDGFPYHRFVNAKNEEEFNDFVSTCKKLAFYETGVTASYGDKLITLSTCEYTQAKGRLVIVAKRIL